MLIMSYHVSPQLSLGWIPNHILILTISFYSPRLFPPPPPRVPASFLYPFWAALCGTGAILISATAAAKSPRSCLALCDPIDGSPSGSAVPGILQARTLEWVAISFFSAWKWKVKVKALSRVWLLATPRTAAHQAPPSMGFSRQEYWSGLLLPFPYLNL